MSNELKITEIASFLPEGHVEDVVLYEKTHGLYTIYSIETGHFSAGARTIEEAMDIIEQSYGIEGYETMMNQLPGSLAHEVLADHDA